MIRTAIALISAMTATTAAADMAPDSVSIPIYVHHDGFLYENFNEGFANNLGVLLTWDVVEDVQFTAGLYNNSFDQHSWTAFVEYEPFGGENWSAGVFAGLATYDADKTPLFMASRIGDSDFVGMGGVRVESGSLRATWTPSDLEGETIYTSGITFDF